MPNDDGLARFRLRLNFPYLLGTYLGINAIPGAYLLVDGPDCAFLKAQHVWGRHDLASTLLDPAGQHRVLFSGGDGRTAGQLEQRRDDLLRSPEARLIALTSLSAASAAANDTAEPAARAVAQSCGDPRVVHVAGASLQGDWLDGYAGLLETLATELPLAAGRANRCDVGVVGYLFDRNEADQRANVAALRRLLERSGLCLVSMWLSGAGPDELSTIGRAGTIVSLPYGRRAARLLCARTGAELIELDLPIGLAGTAEWLRKLAARCDRSEQAERTIRERLEDAIPRLDPLVGRMVLGRRFLLGQDPFLAAGLWGLLEELGGEIAGAVLPARPAHHGALQGAARLDSGRILFEPREGEIEPWIESRRGDLAITNSELARYVRGPNLELGFPSVHHHAIFDSPFVGFRGTVALVERVINELARVPRG
jgi:nitrogenase molybdenum-iron protein alpha/beta subunit